MSEQIKYEKYELPESLKDLKKKRDNHFKEAKDFKDKKAKSFRENDSFYRGNQVKQKDSRPIKNFTFSIIETETSMIVDSRPGTDVVAIDETRIEDAKVLDAAVQYTYYKQKLLMKLIQGVRAALISGPAAIYVGYDHDAENGQGSAIYKNVPWKYYWLDPAANEIDDSTYLFVRIPARIDEIRRLYPKMSKYIRPASIDDTSNDLSNTGRNPDVWRSSLSEDKENDDRFNGTDMSYIEEYWCRDYSVENIPEDETNEEIEKENLQFINIVNPDISKFEDHQKHIDGHQRAIVETVAQALQVMPQDISETDIENLKEDPRIGLFIVIAQDHIEMHKSYLDVNPSGQRPKYKNYWRVSIWSADVLLYEGPDPVGDGLLPMAQIFANKEAEDIYGTGDVEQLKDCQKSFNDMDFSEYKGLRLVSNPGFVKTNNSGLSAEEITNDEGAVYTINQGSEFRRLEPGTVSPQLSNRKYQDLQDMQFISGIHDASIGKRPVQITAARAIEALQSATSGRMRLKDIYMTEYTMPRIGMLTASRIIKYWSTERKLRIYDAGGKIKYIKYDPSKVQDLEYEIRMSPGSTAGISKEAIYTFMLSMFQAGAIDARTLFSVTDVPYKNKILDYIDQNDQTKMAIQQLMAENQQLKQELAGAANDLAQTVPPELLEQQGVEKPE